MTNTQHHTQSRFYFVIVGRDWDGEEVGTTWILDADQLPIAARPIDTDWALSRGVIASFLRTQLMTMFEWFDAVEVAKVTPAGTTTFRKIECGFGHPGAGEYIYTDRKMDRLGIEAGEWVDPEFEIVVA